MHIFKKIVIWIIAFLFFVIFIFQILLRNPYTKTKISKLYEFESKYVYSEQVISKGVIKLKISRPSDDLFLLQNGERTEVLNKKEIDIEIFDNTVLEIDGRNCSDEIKVEICDLSKNIDGFYECNIIVSSKIVVLGRFFVK